MGVHKLTSFNLLPLGSDGVVQHSQFKLGPWSNCTCKHICLLVPEVACIAHNLEVTVSFTYLQTKTDCSISQNSPARFSDEN